MYSPSVLIRMAKLSLSVHLLLLCISLLAHNIQGCPLLPINQEIPNGHNLPSEEARKDISYYAVHQTYNGSYFGMVATLDVYGYGLSDGQTSVSAIWIGNLDGDVNTDLDSIAVGWEVHPGVYGDSLTHFYTEWTRDSYQNTGCRNTDCAGFQLVSGSEISPGAVIEPVSDVNGSRQKITVKVFKDQSNGDWWIHYGFNSEAQAVGFYPAKLFDSLDKKATHIAFGGAVNVLTNHTLTLPPMGSGSFPSDKAATLSDIALIEENSKITPINIDTATVETKTGCYSTTPIQGAMFSYGGPGGCSAQV